VPTPELAKLHLLSNKRVGDYHDCFLLSNKKGRQSPQGKPAPVVPAAIKIILFALL